MTRGVKAICLAAAVFGLAVGAYRGHAEANQTSDFQQSIQYIAPTQIASDFARVQFMRADSDHARQAVMSQINLLQRLQLADKTFHSDGELAMAYIRLAMVEESVGHLEEQNRALGLARACFERAHPQGKQGTDDELKAFVRRWDKVTDH